jgi:hypothetical protein
MRFFPGEEIREWEEEDQQGAVWGWPSTVNLHLVQFENNWVLGFLSSLHRFGHITKQNKTKQNKTKQNKITAKLRPQLTLGEISMILRERAFYNERIEGKEGKEGKEGSEGKKVKETIVFTQFLSLSNTLAETAAQKGILLRDLPLLP